MLKRFNQIVYSNKEPVNKNDIWIDDNNVIRIYKNGNWEVINESGGGEGSIDPELLEGFIPLSRDFSDDFNNEFTR